MALARDEDMARIQAEIKNIPATALPYYVLGFKDGANWECIKWTEAADRGDEQACRGPESGHAYPPCTGLCCQGGG